jgi:dihydrolipoamide dehydrogenase
METFDLVVIGAGPGGYPAAIRGAQLGARVALVEKEALGGTCLNWGCIPTKTLLASAEVFTRLRHAAEFGLQADNVGADYAKMAGRKNEVVRRLRDGIGQLLKANGVRVFSGSASFRDRHHIAVGPATTLETRATIVATGSVSAVPGFLPRHPRVLESRAFLDLTQLPQRLIVLGGGVIGCEFACLAAQLGVQVTVVELLEDILMTVDADVRKELRRHMEGPLGIRILTGKPLESIAADDRSVSGKAGEQALAADLLLVAVGRRPVTAELNLAAAGVSTGKAGFVGTDACGQTSAASVYAVGDVNGGIQLAHNATSQGVIAAENALRKTRRAFETVVPSCIFTSPEIGAVGLTEEQAAALGRTVKTGRFPFAALGKALAMGHAQGFVKWVADAATDQLLGCQAIGPHATDLLAEAAVAIRGELTARELGRTIHAHPTLAEALMEAAHAVHGECVHAPPKRR